MTLGRSQHNNLEREPILRAVSAFYGVTSADGAVGGTTLICSDLIGSNDFITGKVILLESGLSALEHQGATGFAPVTGTITFPAFSSRVLAGTGFYVLTQQAVGAAIALILADLAVPAGDAVANVLERDVIGNKADTADIVLGNTSSLMRYQKGILAQVNALIAGGGVPKLYIGNLNIAADTTDANDVVITGDLSIAAGFAYTVRGRLQVYGNITNAGTLTCLPLECGGSLENTGPNPVTVKGNCQVGTHVVNSGGGAITINGKLDINGDGNASEGYLDNTGGASVFVGGDCHVSGANAVVGIVNTTGTISIMGDLYANGFNGGISQIDHSNNGVFQVFGNCHAVGLYVEGAAQVYVLGDLHVGGLGMSVTGPLEVDGDCQVDEALENTGAAGLTIKGNCQVGYHVTNSGGGTITIKGKLDINGDQAAADGYLQNTGGGEIIITGDTFIAGMLENPTADITISGDCHIDSLVLGAGSLGSFTVVGRLEVPKGIVLGAAAFVSGSLECGSDFVAATDGVDITVHGDCQIAGALSVGGGLSGTMAVYGKLNAVGGITLADGAQLTAGETVAGVTGIVLGAGATFTSASCVCEGAFTANTDGVAVTINGDCQIVGALSVGGGTSGTMTVAGTCDVSGAVTIATGASLLIGGVAHLLGVITNAGTLTYMGTYPEQSISQGLAAGPASDLVNLTSTTKRYTIDYLVLKCDDPGVETVTIRLYKLVNAVLVNVASFDITTVNYGTYFTLMDMFGVPLLAGDTIQITGETTGGTPMVIGSYTVRTDNGGTASGGVVPPM